MGPPTEVEVGAEVAERGLPAAQVGEEAALDEGAGEGDGQGVGVAVVLSLVGAPGGRPRQEPAASRRVDRQGPQDAGVGVVDVLGSDDPDRGRAAPGVDEGDEGGRLGVHPDGQEPGEGGGGVGVGAVRGEGAVGRGAHRGPRVRRDDGDGDRVAGPDGIEHGLDVDVDAR